MLDLQKQHLQKKIEVAEKDLENKELFRAIITKTLDMKIFGDSPRGLAYQFGIGAFTVVRYSKEAERCLISYAWPGNVRELMNFCQRVALLNPGKAIQLDDLPEEMMPERAANNHAFTLPPSGIKLAQVELDLIEQALVMASGNRSRAARLLGISRDTLLYRMQKHSL